MQVTVALNLEEADVLLLEEGRWKLSDEHELFVAICESFESGMAEQDLYEARDKLLAWGLLREVSRQGIVHRTAIGSRFLRKYYDQRTPTWDEVELSQV